MKRSNAVPFGNMALVLQFCYTVCAVLGPYHHLVSSPSDQYFACHVKVLRMGAARKKLGAAGAEMEERQTAQREAIEEASKSRGESGQGVNQGNS